MVQNPTQKNESGSCHFVKEPLVVLLVIESLRGGGAERQMSQIANYWAKKGWQVTLATWTSDSASDFYTLDIAVERVHLKVGSKLRTLHKSVLTLAQLIRRVQPGVVLSFSESSNVITFLACFLTRKRSVLAIRTNPEYILRAHRWWRFPVLGAYRYGSEVVVQTRAVAKWCQTECGRKARVIPNIIRKLPTPSDDRDKTILIVGSLLEYKGHDILIKAFCKLHDRYPEWRLNIVGDGPMKQDLLLLREELDLMSKVTFLGVSAKVEDWMERAGIFVLTSRFEGFPNVLIEAMAMGAPVISTDCPHGPSEIIMDNENGRLVAVDNIDELAEVIVELIDAPELRKKLGLRAQAVRSYYHEDAVMALWEKVLFPQQ